MSARQSARAARSRAGEGPLGPLYGKRLNHFRSKRAKKATTAATLKPMTLRTGSSSGRVFTPVRAPQFRQILAVALICLPQVLHLGMAQPSRPEQR
jgi:hypothetical protein